MNYLKTLLFVSSLCVFATGCSGVRVVNVSKDGGEIALLGDREGAMEKARKEMSIQCGGRDKFEIVEQGEVVVGQVSRTRSSARSRRRGRTRVGFASSNTTTRDRTEWRVIFECVTDEPDEVAKQHIVAIPMSM